MKRTVIAIMFMIISPGIKAQITNTADSFKVTPEGFTQSVIREYPEKSDDELFQSVIMWAKFTIDNYEEAITRNIANQYLEFRMFVPQGIALKDNGEVYQWDVMMDVAFRFKDGKIRYDIGLVEVSSPEAPAFAFVAPPEQWSFFDSDGKTREFNQKSQEQINTIANNIIRSVSAYVNRDAKIPDDATTD
ncbi:hypothetical protein RM553_18085 [Zunongwangia sp. F363]|uniref:DUF4468 domain-containing protein n=1 Tax=Autumnicola tepida TaxID=3075595 RepID=A0ABU3CEM4_9FLAO|nr:hypothetical protein [Zunongwangia sp. F363]MDT0644756.1 hypothetical protein [Zunongwangia sp. F363]